MSRNAINHRRARVRPTSFIIEDEAEDRAIARLNRLTDAGRTLWFSLLFYLTFAMVTALGVQDIDFFIADRQTQLPLIGVSIPTASFFLFAPVLGAALYIYLHLMIRKTTEAAAQAPARVKRTRENPKGIPIERAIKPWLVIDVALRFRNDGAIDKRPLDGLALWTTVLLVWLAGPYVMGVLWQNTFTLHNAALTTFTGLLFVSTIYVGAKSWAKLESDTDWKWREVETSKVLRRSTFVLLIVSTLFCGLVGAKGMRWFLPDTVPRLAPFVLNESRVFSTAWFNERHSFFQRINDFLDDIGYPHRTALAAAPDFRGMQLSVLPSHEQNIPVAQAKYRSDWCKRIGHPANACGSVGKTEQTLTDSQSDARRSWCNRYPSLKGDRCWEYFAAQDARFTKEWAQHRRAMIAAIPKPNLTALDLRNANFRGASLLGLDFNSTILLGADFRSADLEAARLTSTRMAKAKLRDAYMATTNLNFSWLQETDFSSARMPGASLISSRMHHTIMNGAILDGALLTGATLDRVNMTGSSMRRIDFTEAFLRSAMLSNVNMTEAIMTDTVIEGVDLNLSNLRSIEWNVKTLETVVAKGADFRGGKNLDTIDPKAINGDATTLLPTQPADLYVCTCWKERPPHWANLQQIAIAAGSSSEFLNEALLCARGRLPMQTGTPLSIHQPTPWEAGGLHKTLWSMTRTPSSKKTCP